MSGRGKGNNGRMDVWTRKRKQRSDGCLDEEKETTVGWMSGRGKGNNGRMDVWTRKRKQRSDGCLDEEKETTVGWMSGRGKGNNGQGSRVHKLRNCANIKK